MSQSSAEFSSNEMRSLHWKYLLFESQPSHYTGNSKYFQCRLLISLLENSAEIWDIAIYYHDVPGVTCQELSQHRKAAQCGLEVALCGFKATQCGFKSALFCVHEATQCGLWSHTMRLRSRNARICEAAWCRLNSWYVTPDYTSGRGRQVIWFIATLFTVPLALTTGVPWHEQLHKCTFTIQNYHLEIRKLNIYAKSIIIYWPIPIFAVI